MAKRIQKDLPIFRPAVTLYRDDLDAIVRVIVDASGGAKISDKENEYESLDELATLRGKSLGVVNIRSDASKQTGWSSTRLSIDRKQVYLSAPDNENGRSLYHKIRDILDSRKRWYCALPFRIPDSISWVWVCAVVMPLAPWIAAICLGPLVGRSTSYAIGCAGTGLWVVYWLLGLVGSMAQDGWGSRVFLCQPHEAAEGMLAKSWKALVYPVLLMVMGGMVTKGCDYTWAKLSPSPPAATTNVDQSAAGRTVVPASIPGALSFAEFMAARDKASDDGTHDQQEFARRWGHAKVRWEGYVSNVIHDGEGTAIVIEIGPKKEDAHVGVGLIVSRYDVTPNLLPVFDAIRKSDRVCIEGELKKPLQPELVPSRIERIN